MKSLVYQQDRHQKVLNQGLNISLCSGSWHTKIWTNMFCSASYFNWGGSLELCFGRDKPTEPLPVVTGLCGKTSACF